MTEQTDETEYVYRLAWPDGRPMQAGSYGSTFKALYARLTSARRARGVFGRYHARIQRARVAWEDYE